MSFNKEKKVIHNIRTEVDSFGRKKYKLEEVVQSGEESQNDDQNAAVFDTGRHKSMLIGRQEGLNIDKYIGKIDTNKKKKVTQVFYCDICSQGFKCDMAYITHINSPAHNRKLGMNMKVKNVSLQTVSSKISSLINKKLSKQQNGQEEQILRKIQHGDEENVRRRGRSVNNSIQQNDDQDEEESSQQDEQNDEQQDNQQVKQQNQIKIQDQQDKQQEQEQQQLDSNELAQQQMMLQMGFGNKKQKR